MSKKKVLILMGSDSDLPAMEGAYQALESLGIESEMRVASAHRTPERVHELVTGAPSKGFAVIIAGAGMAAHLAGNVAAHTTLPVLGVPLASGALDGLDALLATVQMPPGIPVACMGIGKAGAHNAGLLAASILALDDAEVGAALVKMREGFKQKVEEKDAAIQRRK